MKLITSEFEFIPRCKQRDSNLKVKKSCCVNGAKTDEPNEPLEHISNPLKGKYGARQRRALKRYQNIDGVDLEAVLEHKLEQ